MRNFAKHKRFVPKVIKVVGERIEELSTQVTVLHETFPEFSSDELEWVVNHSFNGIFHDFQDKFGDELSVQELVFRLRRCDFVRMGKHKEKCVRDDDSVAPLDVVQFHIPEKVYFLHNILHVDGMLKDMGVDQPDSSAVIKHQSYKPVPTQMLSTMPYDDEEQEQESEAQDVTQEPAVPEPEKESEKEVMPASVEEPVPEPEKKEEKKTPEKKPKTVVENPDACPACGGTDAKILKEWNFHGYTTKRHECQKDHTKWNTYHEADGKYKFSVLH